MLGLVSGFIAGQEWIIIIVLAAVLIFGAKKIPELAKTFGKAKGEFEKGIEDNELKEFKDKREIGFSCICNKNSDQDLENKCKLI